MKHRSSSLRRSPWILALAAGCAGAQDQPPPDSSLELRQPVRERRGPEIPDVGSREDFMAMNRRDKLIYGRTQREPLTVLAGLEYTYSGAQDLDRGGDYDVSRLGGEIGVSLKLSDDADLILVAEPRASFYDFDGAAGIYPFAPAVAEPIEEAYEFPIRLVYRVDKADGWSYFFGGSFVIAGEPGVEFEDAVYGDGFAAASWWVNEKLRVGFGIRGGVGLDGDPNVFPFPVIEWYPTERWSVITGGRGLTVGYEIGAWQLAGEVGLDSPEFGLDDEGPLPGGSVRERQFLANFALSYSPAPRFDITGRVGAVIGGSIQFFDAGGGEVADENLEPAIYTGLSLTLRF